MGIKVTHPGRPGAYAPEVLPANIAVGDEVEVVGRTGFSYGVWTVSKLVANGRVANLWNGRTDWAASDYIQARVNR